MIIPFIVLAVAGVVWAATKKRAPLGTPGNLLPTPGNMPKVEANAKPVIPAGLKGLRQEHKIKVADRHYTVSSYPPEKRGGYVIVQLNGSSAWISYWQQGSDKTSRKLYKAYAKGDRDQSGRVVSIMMGDFGVKK